MALVVHALGAYASYPIDRIGWRRSDFDVNKLVKSLKGEPVKGYSHLRDVNNKIHRIAEGDNTPALLYFSAWAARRLLSLKLGRIALVPVPSSSCTSYRSDTTPCAMARAIQERLGRTASVQQWLRFVEKMPKSHEGGTRRVEVLEKQLRVSSKMAAPATVVLIDDVKTTGAHMKACARKLREFGAVADVAVVAASTVWDQVPDPWSLDPDDLEAPLDTSDFDF